MHGIITFSVCTKFIQIKTKKVGINIFHISSITSNQSHHQFFSCDSNIHNIFGIFRSAPKRKTEPRNYSRRAQVAAINAINWLLHIVTSGLRALICYPKRGRAYVSLALLWRTSRFLSANAYTYMYTQTRQRIPRAFVHQPDGDGKRRALFPSLISQRCVFCVCISDPSLAPLICSLLRASIPLALITCPSLYVYFFFLADFRFWRFGRTTRLIGLYFSRLVGESGKELIYICLRCIYLIASADS